MTEEQKQHMSAEYKKQLKAGLIDNLDGALGFKLGYEAALKLFIQDDSSELCGCVNTTQVKEINKFVICAGKLIPFTDD